MEENGFAKLSTKLFVRLVDNEIIQYISIYVQSSLRREYILEYGAMLLAEPHDFFEKTLGVDFKKGTSGGSYGAQNDKMLDKSINRACLAYKEEILPILTNLSALKNFIKEYESIIKTIREV